MLSKLCTLLVAILFIISSSYADDELNIGFLVKQPEEPWFQVEWKFGEKAANDKGAILYKIATPDGSKTLDAIDNLASVGAKGFVICTPDVRLGPAIMMRAKKYDMKVITVDDRFVKGGEYMMDVPYVGMSAIDIGRSCSKIAMQEAKKRNWDLAETAVCLVTRDELDTTRERTEGQYEMLLKNGMPTDQIFKGNEKTMDAPGAFDITNMVLTQHPNFKSWIILGVNDTAAIGGIRATEGRRIKPTNVIGIGINGTDCITEFMKTEATGFLGSMLPSPNLEGYKTVSMLIDWIRDGKEPPLELKMGDATFITRDNWLEVYKKQGMDIPK